MSSYDSGPNDQSPQDDAPAAKRRRIALACLDCRRRKLKCDRKFPSCSRCNKGGHADKCTYDPDAVETLAPQGSVERNRNANRHDIYAGDTLAASITLATPTILNHVHNPDSPNDSDNTTMARLQSNIRQLENRIVGLERATNGSVQWHGPNRASDLTYPAANNPVDSKDSADKETMMFRGRSLKTQFFGASHHTSYLSHMPQLRVLMKEMIVQHPGLPHVQKELRNMKIKGHGPDEGAPIDAEALLSFLPQKNIADELVRIYIDFFETSYRILHLPSFWEEYSRFWSSPHKARPAFIALLLLMLATTNCIRNSKPSLFRGDSSLGREAATVWIKACDSWLQHQSQKHASLTFFQIHCASLIAKQMNSIKRKRTWTSTGTLLRLAMSAGLHRDAKIVNLRHGGPKDIQVSVFDQEMRRRIWATISELELQTALDRGMPAMMRDLIIDCGPPLNINDEQFDPSTERLSQSGPTSHYTRSSFLHVSHLTWALRLELVSLINAPTQELQYEDLLLYDKRIVQSMDDIPHWSEHESAVPRMLLQLQLQQLLLLLHRPYVRYEPQCSRYDYSATVHLKAAMTILDLHHKLTVVRNPVLSLFRNDILGAALSICYNLSVSEPNPDQNLSNWSFIIGLSDPIRYLENALAMLEYKIMLVGVGLQEYYCVSAAVGVQLKNSNPSGHENEELRSADRVSKMIQKLLTMQDNYSAAATLASLPNMAITASNGIPSNTNGMPSSTNGIQSNTNGMPPVPQMDNIELLNQDFGQDLEGFDLTNPAGWDLDAFFKL